MPTGTLAPEEGSNRPCRLDPHPEVSKSSRTTQVLFQPRHLPWDSVCVCVWALYKRNLGSPQLPSSPGCEPHQIGGLSPRAGPHHPHVGAPSPHSWGRTSCLWVLVSLSLPLPPVSTGVFSVSLDEEEPFCWSSGRPQMAHHMCHCSFMCLWDEMHLWPRQMQGLSTLHLGLLFWEQVTKTKNYFIFLWDKQLMWFKHAEVKRRFSEFPGTFEDSFNNCQLVVSLISVPALPWSLPTTGLIWSKYPRACHFACRYFRIHLKR